MATLKVGNQSQNQWYALEKWSAVMYAPFAVNGLKHAKPLLFPFGNVVRYKYTTLNKARGILRAVLKFN